MLEVHQFVNRNCLVYILIDRNSCAHTCVRSISLGVGNVCIVLYFWDMSWSLPCILKEMAFNDKAYRMHKVIKTACIDEPNTEPCSRLEMEARPCPRDFILETAITTTVTQSDVVWTLIRFVRGLRFKLQTK